MSSSSSSSEPISQDMVEISLEHPDMCQVINEDAKFTNEIGAYMKHWDFLDCGFKYHSVAVLGCQSSGKSTLLNLLFGSDFATLGTASRQRTTKGVWLTKANTELLQQKLGKVPDNNVLVFDVEGTDSSDRGEDHGQFERKISLFSLALSEVLIVNMWLHDIGRQEGANYGLLQIVFEIHLHMFAGKDNHRTLLFFLIRDHSDGTDIKVHEGTMRAHIAEIWSKIKKPEGMEDCKPEDFFDFSWDSLAHKQFQEAEFNAGVDRLRVMFTDDESDQYVFQSKYKKTVPADGFPAYTEAIWTQILSNKDLDLPTQREMLAMYRCDEILEEAYLGVSSEIAEMALDMGSEASKENPSDLGAKLNGFLQSALQEYDDQAGRYLETVYKSKRVVLENKLLGALENVYQRYMSQLSSFGVETVTSRFEEEETRLANSRDNRPLDEDDVNNNARFPVINDFSKFAAKVQEEVVEGFENNAKECRDSIDIETGWEYETEQSRMTLAITSEIGKQRTIHMERYARKVTKSNKVAVVQLSATAMDGLHAHMWASLRTHYNRTLDTHMEMIASKFAEFEASEAEIENAQNDLEDDVFTALKKIMTDKSSDEQVMLKMKKKFEDNFRFDDNMVPRVYTKEDEMKQSFENARRGALQLLQVISILRLEESMDDINLIDMLKEDSGEAVESSSSSSSTTTMGGYIDMVIKPNVLISIERCRSLKARFLAEAGAVYESELRTLHSQHVSKEVPMWMVLVVVLLGWNELIWVLSSPVFTILALAILGVFLGLRTVGLHKVMLDYIETLLSTTVQQLFTHREIEVKVPKGAKRGKGKGKKKTE